MLQRQPRVGDIVDDYCPRERRVSDHAVVAMVDDDIRQTRCTTCDTEHEYRQAKVPPGRKKATAVLPPKPPAGLAAAAPRLPEPATDAEPGSAESAESAASEPGAARDGDAAAAPSGPEGSVHRRLIRAVLPRIEGETPTRQAPEFTMHSVAAKPAARHGRPGRPAHGGSQRPGGDSMSAHNRPHGGRPGTVGSPGNRSARGGHGSHGGPAGHGGGSAGHGGGRHGRPHGSGQGHRKKH